MGMVEGPVWLLVLKMARAWGAEPGAPWEVLILFIQVLFSLSALPMLSILPAHHFFLSFFLFLRPPVLPPVTLALFICDFHMRPLELPWQIPIFLEFFHFSFYSLFSLPNCIFVIIVVDEWSGWEDVVKHPSFCTFVSIMAFLSAVVAIH